MEPIAEPILDLMLSGADNMKLSLEQKGLNASGSLSDSLTGEAFKDGSKIVGVIKADAKPYWALVNRAFRKGTGRPFSSVRFIYDWSIQKGLQFSDERDRLSFAFATSYNQNMEDGYMDYKRAERARFATDVIRSSEFQTEKVNAVQSVAAILVKSRLRFGIKFQDKQPRII